MKILLLLILFPTILMAETTLPDSAYYIASKEPDWAKHLKRVDQAYDQWQKDGSSGDLNSFVNARVLGYAAAARLGGSVKAVKNFMYWMALYKHYNMTPPQFIRDVSMHGQVEFDNYVKRADFSWEGLAEMISKNQDETK
jgi:hypothetical protein